MKRWLSVLVLISLVQISYRVAPVFAENGKDILAIEKVIGKYLEGFNKRDLDHMMSCISPNYSSYNKKGKIVDYEEFRFETGEILKGTTADTYKSGLKIIDSVIQDNKAKVGIEVTVNRINQSKGTNIKENIKRTVSLAKENGYWKITEFENKPKVNSRTLSKTDYSAE